MKRLALRSLRPRPELLLFGQHSGTHHMNLQALVRYHCFMIFDFVLRRISRWRQRQTKPPVISPVEGDDELLEENNPFPEVVTIEFTDVIDLHSIPPKQMRAVVEDYLDEAYRRRVQCVRIIHGKGIGVQREMIRSILERTSFVSEFQDAPPEAGGWGATIVTLRLDAGETA